MNPIKKEAKKLMTVKEVAAWCGVSVSHIYRMTDRGAMPQPVSLGYARRYVRSTIDNWIDDGCPDLSKRKRGNQ